MKKISKSIACLALAGMLSIGGIAGCGGGDDDGDGNGGGGTTAQQQQGIFMYDGTNQLGVIVGLVIQTLTPSALVVDSEKNQTTIDCSSGDYTWTADGTTILDTTTITVDLNDCDTECNVLNGTMTYTVATGTTTFTGVTLDADYGDEIAISGTSVLVPVDADNANLTFDLSGTANGETIDFAGTLAVKLKTFQATGTLTMTDNGTTVATCKLNDFVSLAATINDLAEICGIADQTCD